MSISALLEKRKSNQGTSLLHGSDVPEDTEHFTITIKEVEIPPDRFNAVLIIIFKIAVFGKVRWAVNKTNAQIIAELHGDDENAWFGKKLKLQVVPAQNPTTGARVRSLVVVNKK